MDDEDYLSRKQAARFLTALGCRSTYASLSSMAMHDNAGGGPAFIRSGWKAVAYHKDDLRTWAEGRREKIPAPKTLAQRADMETRVQRIEAALVKAGLFIPKVQG